MSAKPTQTPSAQEPNIQGYNSNPFTLAFQAMQRLFNTNSGWAIALIILGIFGTIGQFARAVARYSIDNSTSSTNTTLSSTGHIDPTVIIAIVIVVLVFVIFALIIGTAISAFINGMFSYVALQSENGKTVSFTEAFNETTKRFWRLFGARLLANLKILGWFLLLIVPGIIATYRYQLLPYLIMNESPDEKGIQDSHTKLKALEKGRLWEVFGVSTVASIVPFIGNVLGLSGQAALFKQLKATEEKPATRPNIHWLNYLGLVLLTFILFIIALLVLLAISFHYWK